METSIKYQVDPQAKIYPPTDRRPKILANVYTSTIKDFMLAMVASGYAYQDEDDLCNMAIAFTDKLIEKVGNKL